MIKTFVCEAATRPHVQFHQSAGINNRLQAAVIDLATENGNCLVEIIPEETTVF